MFGKRGSDPKYRVKINFPYRPKVALVGRTSEDCDEWNRVLKPDVEAHGGLLKVYAQLHDMEDLVREHFDVLLLVPGMDDTAHETVIWTAKRGNSAVVVVDLPA